MSRIKELKNHPEHTVNVIEILSLITPNSKSKYVEMILRIMKNTPNLEIYNGEVIELLHSNFNIDKETLKSIPSFQLAFYHKFLDLMFNLEDLKYYQKFCEFNERGLIDQNDLSKYVSFDDLSSQVDLAELKADAKEMESQIVKIFENDEWVLLRPLTYKSSLKYGANTKWCTASETNYDYFTKYSNNGVLIYTINKKTGLKVACYNELTPNGEFSFWNQKDTRIDSMQSELPMELLMVIKKEIDTNPKSNSSFLTKEQKNKEESMYGRKKLSSMAGQAMIRSGVTLNEDTEVEQIAIEDFENEAGPAEVGTAISAMENEASDMSMESLQPEIEAINYTLRRG